MNATAASILRFLARPVVSQLAFVILAFVLWEVAARHSTDELFTSPPSAVFAAVGALFDDEGVKRAVLTTLWELGLSFLLAAVLGLAVGVGVGASGMTYRSLYPIILLAYAIPQVTILPLFVLYFGPGPASKVAFGFSHGIFPIIVNVVAGLRTVPAGLLRSAYSMGANKRQVFRRITFPHLVPSFFTGMRLGMTATLLGVLLAELYVSSGGIGYYTELYTENFEPQNLFALTGTLALMAVFLNEVVRRAEIRHSRWR